MSNESPDPALNALASSSLSPSSSTDSVPTASTSSSSLTDLASLDPAAPPPGGAGRGRRSSAIRSVNSLATKSARLPRRGKNDSLKNLLELAAESVTTDAPAGGPAGATDRAVSSISEETTDDTNEDEDGAGYDPDDADEAELDEETETKLSTVLEATSIEIPVQTPQGPVSVQVLVHIKPANVSSDAASPAFGGVSTTAAPSISPLPAATSGLLASSSGDSHVSVSAATTDPPSSTVPAVGGPVSVSAGSTLLPPAAQPAGHLTLSANNSPAHKRIATRIIDPLELSETVQRAVEAAVQPLTQQQPLSPNPPPHKGRRSPLPLPRAVSFDPITTASTPGSTSPLPTSMAASADVVNSLRAQIDMIKANTVAASHAASNSISPISPGRDLMNSSGPSGGSAGPAASIAPGTPSMPVGRSQLRSSLVASMSRDSLADPALIGQLTDLMEFTQSIEHRLSQCSPSSELLKDTSLIDPLLTLDLSNQMIDAICADVARALATDPRPMGSPPPLPHTPQLHQSTSHASLAPPLSAPAVTGTGSTSTFESAFNHALSLVPSSASVSVSSSSAASPYASPLLNPDLSKTEREVQRSDFIARWSDATMAVLRGDHSPANLIAATGVSHVSVTADAMVAASTVQVLRRLVLQQLLNQAQMQYRVNAVLARYFEANSGTPGGP